MNATDLTQFEQTRTAIAKAKQKPLSATTPTPAPKPTLTHVREDNRHAARGRLPNGSRFDVSYDATTRTWSGTLIVNGSEYRSSASGVFTLLAMLDEMYRAKKYGSAEK